MTGLVQSNFRFSVTREISAEFASFGKDHLCLIFYRNGERISSVCMEAPGRMDYLSEGCSVSVPICGLSAAIRKAETETDIPRAT